MWNPFKGFLKKQKKLMDQSQLRVNEVVAKRKYNIRILGRGEEIFYSDGNVKLWLERTYCDGHRLYCSNTENDDAGIELAFSKRKSVIQNLCDYFDTKRTSSIFVLDEADKDRCEFELLFSDLVSDGHKIIIEYDNVKKREKAQDKMHINILKAGKTLSIDDVKIVSIKDYWQWKKNRSLSSDNVNNSFNFYGLESNLVENIIHNVSNDLLGLFNKRTKRWHHSFVHCETYDHGVFDDLIQKISTDRAYFLIPAAVNIVLLQNEHDLFITALSLLQSLIRASNTTEIPPLFLEKQAIINQKIVLQNDKKAKFYWDLIKEWYRLN